MTNQNSRILVCDDDELLLELIQHWFSAKGHIVAALSLGASDYLVKPFIPEELVARLSRLITKAA